MLVKKSMEKKKAFLFWFKKIMNEKTPKLDSVISLLDYMYKKFKANLQLPFLLNEILLNYFQQINLQIINGAKTKQIMVDLDKELKDSRSNVYEQSKLVQLFKDFSQNQDKM